MLIVLWTQIPEEHLRRQLELMQVVQVFADAIDLVAEGLLASEIGQHADAGREPCRCDVDGHAALAQEFLVGVAVVSYL